MMAMPVLMSDVCHTFSLNWIISMDYYNLRVEIKIKNY